MLYDSDSSIPDDDEDEEDSNELLGGQPSTSRHGNVNRSDEIFTIQMTNGQSEGGRGTIPKTPTYSHLDAGGDDEADAGAPYRQASFLSSLSLGNLHKARSFLGKQKLGNISKSDTQFHCVRRHDDVGTPLDVVDRDRDADQSEASDDDVTTLTSRGQGRASGGRIGKRWSYDPGGSSLLTAWSTYSELLLEFQGLSWDCCVAVLVRICLSEQCQAYTKFLKMAAWFVAFVLVLLCFRPEVYRTVIQRPGSVPDRGEGGHSGSVSLLDILYSNGTS